ncbi:MAG TPA: FKBP-type peptidyl-prolyl cis-trans isomerase, partial [Bacteroidales bacterium]|nr:FKBP-type peptidyl-prolyl cis-trans isomerase [Bacteroidales bacterium]
MKKQNRFIFLTLLTVFMISATSCMKDDDSEKRENEKRLINNYVQANNITVTPTTSGLYVIPQVAGTGATPGTTDFALIEYNAFDLEGHFFDGTNLTLANQAKVNTYFALGGPLKIYMGQGYFLDGVTEGLKQMKEGGEAKMIMPSLLAYNDYVPRIINVKLIKVITNPLAYEKEQIANYLDTVTMPVDKERLEVEDS